MFNQRELNLIQKANEELEQVQANGSVRLLCREDIEDCIKEAKKAFNNLDPIERKYLIKLRSLFLKNNLSKQSFFLP